jgi:cysteinyl-tRNA synthetase
MQAGARVDVNAQKEDPMDFVLWKGAKPGEPKWPSPWGEGRPGWHIECSAMSRKYLGKHFDIHGGGQDLIFPHHENEIAQSVGANCQPFAQLWMHHGFVTVKEEKMSKSLGNFLTIRDVLAQYPAETLRLFLFSTQYRNPLDFNETALQDAQIGLDRMYDCLAQIAALPKGKGTTCLAPKDQEKILALNQDLTKAMNNDFNTAQALGHLFDAVKVLNKVSRTFLNQTGSAEDWASLQQGGEKLRELAGLFGLLQQYPRQYMQEKKLQLLKRLSLSEEEILSRLAQRKAARERKDWAASDAIRNELLSLNIEVQDSPEGSTWTVKLA